MLPPVWHKRNHVANQLESLLKNLACEDKLCYNSFSPLSTYCVIPSSVPIKTPWVLCSTVSYAAPVTADSCPLQCCTKQRDEHLSYVDSFIFTTGVFAKEQLALDLSWSIHTHNCVQADRSTKSYDKNGQKTKQNKKTNSLYVLSLFYERETVVRLTIVNSEQFYILLRCQFHQFLNSAENIKRSVRVTSQWNYRTLKRSNNAVYCYLSEGIWDRLQNCSFSFLWQIL